MITINRRQLKIIRRVFNRALGITARQRHAALGVQPTPAGLTLYAGNDTARIRWTLPGHRNGLPFSLPLSTLANVEGHSDDPVTFQIKDREVQMNWHDVGIPQSLCVEMTEPPPAPVTSARLQSIDRSLLRALAEAVGCADSSSSRYALQCLQLRGDSGKILASDGRQASVHAGFKFPWTGDLLVPASRVLQQSPFTAAADVAVAAGDTWFTLQADAWQLDLPIDRESRFPRVEDIIPNPATATTTLHIDDRDARYLLTALPRLPGADDANAAITLAMGDRVLLRCRDEQRQIELELTRSRSQGQPLRCSLNRNYMTRALTLGFREFHYHGPESPVLCRDAQRHYFHALHTKESILPPHPDQQPLRTADNRITRTRHAHAA